MTGHAGPRRREVLTDFVRLLDAAVVGFRVPMSNVTSGATARSNSANLSRVGTDPSPERIPLEKLRLIHEYEQQRLGLTRTVGIGAGIVGALATGKILLK